MWSIKGINPFDEFRNLQREMNRVFGNYEDEKSSFPPVNIYGNEEKIIMTAELPGFKKDELDISVRKNSVRIEGTRGEPELEENDVYHRRERGFGKFVRSFRLPYDVNNEKITANYKDGILTVTLPRSEHSKPKKVAITTN